MEDLLKTQIHENCKLSLPEGLKDLMSDISREVLRAQPQDLYQFIANYLGALLEARETLSIAYQVCSDICTCTCDQIKPELYNELRKIGLNDEDLENAIEIIEMHLNGDEKVKEQSLLLKLSRKTNIIEEHFPKIQQAIQKACKRDSLHRRDLMSKEIFVCPDFKPCVTTVSSTSLAGSFIRLPKHQPYSAHEYDAMSTISEKERLSIDYTQDAAVTIVKPNKIEITNETTVLKEKKKYKTVALFDDYISQNEDSNDEYLPTIDCTEDIKLNTAKETVVSKENNTKYKSSMQNDSKNLQSEDKAITSTKLNSKLEISVETTIGNTDENFKEMDNNFVPLEDNSDEVVTNNEGEYSDYEVEESIENFESENESIASSILEFLQKDVDD